VAVACYENPSLSARGVAIEARLATELGAEDIPWASAGSRGFTLNVPASRAEAAVAILKAHFANDVHIVSP